MEDQSVKSRIISDVVVENASNSNEGSFLIFTELKYEPYFVKICRNETPQYFSNCISSLDFQCQTNFLMN